jgi:hypothetical protein
MKAISLKQPWASMIRYRIKLIETRTWPTSYRGDILIVSCKKPKLGGLPTGKALCIAEIVNCRPMLKSDELLACCEYNKKAYSWILDNIRPIEPFDVKGALGIYEVDTSNIKFINPLLNSERRTLSTERRLSADR